MSSDFRIIFIHGYTASSKENWYPEISKELTRLGIDFVVPDLPGGEHPHSREWLEVIHKNVSETDKPIVFVGHSLGTRTVLLYLEKYPVKVKAVFLVAAFANSLENATKYDNGAYPDFFEHLVDVEKVKKLADKFVVMHSKDDELDYQQAVEICQDLSAKLYTYENRSHFSEPEDAEYIFKILRSELNF